MALQPAAPVETALGQQDAAHPSDGQPLSSPAVDENHGLDASLDDPTMAIFNAVADAVSAPGPLPRLELLEDYYMYLNSTPLRTVVLRIVGHNSRSEVCVSLALTRSPCSSPSPPLALRLSSSFNQS